MATERSYRLSVLDVSPVPSGSSSADALRNTLDLAQLADALGYTRYWLAEHHNTPLIASSVPEVMIGHVAAVTRRIRVGSGGVMLPNHAPLKVAESFRVLEALHPGRVDLGLGRAPGTDSLTALALRRSREALSADDFPAQLDELLGFLDGGFPDNHPFQRIRAMPDDVPMPEIWLLGSSDFSAELAARLGLRFAFAHHISPWPAVGALRFYSSQFRPSPKLAQPESILAVSVLCAETDERAEELAKPLELTLLRFRQGSMGRFPSQAEAAAYPYTPEEREIIQANRARSIIGSPGRVRERIMGLAEQAKVEEIMITTMTHDHQDRRRSYELLAEAFSLSPTRQPRGLDSPAS
ncbi:MAG TPA: LLM class flavin-dependent oxidoreductase [Candidatus Polarisedimenticolia bacterium]|nr:LLM class flavin-dependent oxidoreductase [Candidatus Polarisedimenticolia bacterium]